MPDHDSRSPNKQDIDLGFRIRKRRQDLNISLEKVAKKLDVSKQQLRKYELGRNKISAIRLGQIATILETTTDNLLGKNQSKKSFESSLIDKEAEFLWMKIENPEYKRTFIAMMRMVIKSNT